MRLNRRQVARHAVAAGEGGVELDDVARVVASRRGQEADPRARAARGVEHVVVEGGVARLLAEPAAAERHDLARPPGSGGGSPGDEVGRAMAPILDAAPGRRGRDARTEIPPPALARRTVSRPVTSGRMSRHIVACGGGGWSSDTGHRSPRAPHPGPRRGADAPAGLPAAHRQRRLRLARGALLRDLRPRPCCEPSHLPLFRSHPEGLEEYLLAQDVIYVGGGSSANLMADLGRSTGSGPSCAGRGRRGVVLSGVSAGAICWFAGGLTNSLGPGFAPVAGLGLLPGGFCPHADSDPGRVVALRALIGRGADAGHLRGRRRGGGAPGATAPRPGWSPRPPAAAPV